MSTLTRGRPGSAAGALLPALAVLLLPLVARAQEPDAFTSALERGPLYAAGAALVGGFLVSLTPCVYPMIAITVSVFGARQTKSRGQSMLLSSCFVLGIIAMFVPLGLFAGLTGSLFGVALSNPWVNVGLAVVFLALAASMFGAFEMVLPSGLMQKLSGVGGIGYGGAFLLGLVSGLMAAPCTGPVLTGILVYIGKTQSAALGAGAMLAFSIGLGIPFWLVGTFAVSLPKSGKWMVGVKSFFGVVMVVVALYFLKLTFPSMVGYARAGTTFLLVAVGVTVAGLLLGAVHLDWSDGGFWVKARKAAGIVLMTAGGFSVIASFETIPESAAGPVPPGSGPQLTFGHSEPEAVARAKAEKRPLLIDFTASWCKACGKLDRETFADPRVRQQAGSWVAVKVDVSIKEDLSDEEQERLEEEFDKVKAKYKVVGLPTVLVFDSAGKERVRLTDFVGPDKFLKLIEGIN